MKRVSKILSVLMVAVMMFSLVAIPSSAAWDQDTESTIKYVFKDKENGNVITSAEKGQIVWMYVVLNWNKNVLNFQGTFKWDKDVLTLVRKNGVDKAITGTTQTFNLCGDFAKSEQVELTDADGDMFTQDDDNNMIGYYTTYGAGSKTFNHDCTIASWDDAKKAQYQAYTFIYTSNLDDTTNQLLVNTKGEDLEFAQLCFKVNEDTELTEAVLSNDEAFATMNYIDVTDDQSWYFVPYAKTEFTTYAITPVDGKLAIGAPAPAEKEVKHADTMAQWADKAAGKINVGLVGKFLTEDIAIDYEGNKLTNVAKVGAKVTINGKEIENYTDFVYDVKGDGSELWFRAVVTGVDYNATGAAGDISVVYVVEMTDGTTYESIAYTTTVAEVYAEACNNGMPAFGA